MRLSSWILPAVISILALADGALHFMLDVVLFRGNFFGRLGPPPGAQPAAAQPGPPPGPPIPLPLPLNQMFLVNLIGYVVLVALLWLVITRLPRLRRWMDGLLIVYVVLAFAAWWEFGRPNPMGLGYLSKGIEIVLLVALLTHTWLLSREDRSASATQPGDREQVLAR